MSKELVFNRVAARSSKSREAIDLANGYPTFGAPPWLQDYFLACLQRPRTTTDEPYGISELREAVASDVEAAYQVNVDAIDEVTITGSASEALTAAVLATSGDGSNVVMLSPHFPVYSAACRLAGATPKFCQIEANGTVDWDQLVGLVDRNTSAVVLNTPHNPTGSVFPQTAVSRLVSKCHERGAVLIVDEVFSHLLYEGSHFSPLEAVGHVSDHVITISDSGKKFDLGGYRVGYIIAGASISRRVRAVQQLITYRVPESLQRTIAFGLRSARANYYDDLKTQLEGNASLLIKSLTTRISGLKLLNRPAAGFFLLAAVDGIPSAPLAAAIADEYGIHTLPNSAFLEDGSAVRAEEFIRISFGKNPNQIREACSRLSANR